MLNLPPVKDRGWLHVGSCVYEVNQVLPHSSHSSVHSTFGGNKASKKIIKELGYERSLRDSPGTGTSEPWVEESRSADGFTCPSTAC